MEILKSVRTINPPTLPGAARGNTLTHGQDDTHLFAHEYGVLAIRGQHAVIIPWANLEQVNLPEIPKGVRELIVVPKPAPSAKVVPLKP